MTETESLGNRMKGYEREFITIVPKNKAYIVRLDGRCFSTFFRALGVSFDTGFRDSMVLTMNDLVLEFRASTGYTHSDEITLIFPACEEKQVHLFSGRVSKTVSVMAGFCSVRFNHHITEKISNTVMYSDRALKMIKSGRLHFDARLFSPGEVIEVMNHQIWRSLCDCHRNSVQSMARVHFSTKQLHKKRTKEMVVLLRGIGVFHEELHMSFRYGVYAKRENYEKEEGVVRTRIRNKLWKIESSTEALNELLVPKWTSWSDEMEPMICD